jgi:hypothetical protein
VSKEGWFMPINCSRFHYFRNTHSLCKKWISFSPHLQPDNGDQDEKDCVICRRILLKEQQKTNGTKH